MSFGCKTFVWRWPWESPHPHHHPANDSISCLLFEQHNPQRTSHEIHYGKQVPALSVRSWWCTQGSLILSLIIRTGYPAVSLFSFLSFFLVLRYWGMNPRPQHWAAFPSPAFLFTFLNLRQVLLYCQVARQGWTCSPPAPVRFSMVVNAENNTGTRSV